MAGAPSSPQPFPSQTERKTEESEVKNAQSTIDHWAAYRAPGNLALATKPRDMLRRTASPWEHSSLPSGYAACNCINERLFVLLLQPVHRQWYTQIFARESRQLTRKGLKDCGDHVCRARKLLLQDSKHMALLL
jgi:hypothetical protein